MRDLRGFFDSLLQFRDLELRVGHIVLKNRQTITFVLCERSGNRDIGKQEAQITPAKVLASGKYVYMRDLRGFFDSLLQFRDLELRVGHIGTQTTQNKVCSGIRTDLTFSILCSNYHSHSVAMYCKEVTPQ